MAAGDTAEAVAEAEKHKAETQADTEHTDVRACKHGAAAGEDHEEHCADSLG